MKDHKLNSLQGPDRSQERVITKLSGPSLTKWSRPGQTEKFKALLSDEVD